MFSTPPNKNRSGESSATVGEQIKSQAEKSKKKQMADPFVALSHQRGAVKGKLTRIKNSLRYAGEDALPEVHLLQTYLKTIEATYEEFNSFQNRIYALAPDNMEDQEAKYIEFEDLYNEVRCQVCRLLDLHAKQEEQKQVIVPTTSSEPVSLPAPITRMQPSPFLNTPLPTFDGKPENWFKFKAIFTDIIRRFPGESDATKLYHLDKCLVGEAAGTIDQQTINDSNFGAAWQFLIDRFEDRRKIIDIHVNGLLNLKPMTWENGKQLRDLLDECKRHVEALRFHEFELSGASDIIVVNIIVPDLTWIPFLTARSQVLERVEPSTLKKKTPTTHPPRLPPLKASSLAASVEYQCNFCDGSHANHLCPEFLKLDPNARSEKAKQVRLCFNCLRKGHVLARCSSTKSCNVCKRRHHTTLHANPTTAINENVSQPTFTPTMQPVHPSTSQHPINKHNPVISASCVLYQQKSLLCTAVVNVLDGASNLHPCRVLLDCGSQVNILTEKVATLIRAKRNPVNVKVIGVDGAETNVTSMVHVTVKALQEDYTSKFECLVMKRITGIVPATYIDVSTWPVPTDLQLADPHYNCPQKVDMLIGISHFFGLLKSGKIKLAEHLPYLQQTVFGWVVGGLVDTATWNYKLVHCNAAVQESKLDGLVQRFWEQEEILPARLVSSEETACEAIYNQTHTRDSSGRYTVKLPFRDNVSQLGDSKHHALQRFDYLEKKLQRNSELAYCAFMAEYIELGHCKIVDPSDDGFYLPHHAILKPSSSTTKLRTVFDASAKSTSGLSLNDTLMIGPTIQDPLLFIILRFRTHRYVFTGDISKMYRKINIHPEHTKYQRVLWRNHPTEALQTMELTTVTYGTTSAPYLATRTLKQLVQDEGREFPVGGPILDQDFYVDDMLSGGDSVEHIKQARTELVQLLRRGGFNLHKWCSNSSEFLSTIPEDQREKQISFDKSDVNDLIKTLGLLWNPLLDHFTFHISAADCQRAVTKRYILSEIAKIFDPLGLLAPVVILAKLLLREVWKRKLNWDDELPADLIQSWNKFRSGLRNLADVKINRLVLSPQRVAVELHAFSDASQNAFGTCIYLRSIMADNTVEVHLLVSKSRVAPKATIPRLELCGFLLSARLVDQIASALKVNIEQKVLWSDSQIVLWWLRKPLHLLKSYVANRVAEISKLVSDCEYKYIRTHLNPADLVSRGLQPEGLKENRLWWYGPDFLKNNPYEEEKLLEIESLPGLKLTVNLATVPQVNSVLTKFSSFRKLQRVGAYIVRFVNKTRKRRSPGDDSRFPTIFEIRQSTMAIIRVLQQECLSSERTQILKCQSSTPTKRYLGKLRNLNPWIDGDGILRVNGRIKYANVSYERRCPAILPDKHHVTQLIIDATHAENLHVGPNATLSLLRQKFWLLNGRNSVRFRLRKCIRCFRVNPTESKLYMGDLPPHRITPTYAFERTGIDFAGPIYVRKGHPRKPVYTKGYISLFVCMVTKGIHLEFVSNLSTEAFIAALHRFTSRRGVPTDIFTDNATNFVGANSELHELYVLFKQQQMEKAIHDFTIPQEIRWHFIPPRSPHVGGLWEAGIKSAKKLIQRTAGDTKLTEEEWSTLLAKIEGVLNSRPLVPQSSDPSDTQALTPGHFLIDRPIRAIPEPCYDHIKPGLLSRWQHIQKMRADFWKRWSADYLSELQQRQKWNTGHTEIRVGDLVLMKEENLPPLQWKLARVTDIHPGKDNITRVVTVKTSTNTYKRSTAKLALLPLDEDVPGSSKD
ncbi:uncharacterized protein LOC129742489 [Uranotaenia lowii]|uniref:uncharacterized protein LOC129742489 n=1 Tax=Uranotaenia lowii TaxID=190385 RepID=UPI002479A88F|nr:uncharacterized protein LOC129742489 [Uranotaenia lowii]